MLRLLNIAYFPWSFKHMFLSSKGAHTHSLGACSSHVVHTTCIGLYSPVLCACIGSFVLHLRVG